MQNIKIGTKLKRTHYDYATVEVIDIVPGSEHIIIRDKNGEHFVNVANIDTHFTIVPNTEPEEEILSTAHSIAAGMNDPSKMQQKAFEEENK